MHSTQNQQTYRQTANNNIQEQDKQAANKPKDKMTVKEAEQNKLLRYQLYIYINLPGRYRLLHFHQDEFFLVPANKEKHYHRLPQTSNK